MTFVFWEMFESISPLDNMCSYADENAIVIRAVVGALQVQPSTTKTTESTSKEQPQKALVNQQRVEETHAIYSVSRRHT